MAKNNILNLNNIKGKLLVFGGVYSNLEALQEMMKIANEKQIEPSNIICTGDIVGYCSNPEETIQEIKKWGIHAITGNVEIQLGENKDNCGCDFTEGSRCDSFSKLWYPYAQTKISESSLNWIKKLPEFIKFTYGNKKCFVVHGSFHNTSEFIFKSTDWNVKEKNFNDTNSNLILSGHCGLPFNHVKDNLMWLNPGVIGMPANDGTKRVWYMILDLTTDGKVSFKHSYFEYNQNETATKMIKNNLPSSYAKTLKTGLWDNCDILPSNETKKQGVNISF